MSPEPHPSPEQLAAYARAELSEPAAEAVADHLDRCGDCEATVASFEKQGDTFLGGLCPSPPTEPFVEEPECRQAVERVRAIGPQPATLAHAPSAMPNARKTQQPSELRHLREYQLLEKLGQGGMGTVYKALHTKLDKLVALKVLPAATMQDTEVVARFEREMKAVGKLEHPNIVRAMDAGCHEGTHFLVMEYVDGMDLAHIVKRCGPLRIADACEAVRQAALGLRHADEHTLVHRDIKPSNLVLSTAGEVKILDLGLALLQAEPKADEEATSQGRAMGTVDYMAPEQARDSHLVDIRADIYSLGCTLYKLIIGQAPFSGPEYKSSFDKMMAHVSQSFPSVRQSRPDVPERLAAVLKRMVAKDRDARYAKPSQVVEELKPFCPGCDLAGLLLQARKGPQSASNMPSPSGKGAGGEGMRSPRPARPSEPPAVSAKLATPPALGAALPTPPKPPTARSPEVSARKPEGGGPGRPAGPGKGGVKRSAPSVPPVPSTPAPQKTAAGDSFDPYHKWLGIPPQDQPPNHYRLLGIPLFEEDRDVIQSAASGRSAHLKTLVLGKHQAESQRLLNEVQVAKICLLTPQDKAAYDARLRKELAAKESFGAVRAPGTVSDVPAADDERETFSQILGDIAAPPPPHPRAAQPRIRPGARVLALLRRLPPVAWIAGFCSAAAILLLTVIYITTGKGTLKIELSEPTENVQVTVDGHRVDIASLKDGWSFSVGTHALEVTSRDCKPFAQPFTISRGQTELVKVTLVPETKPGPGSTRVVLDPALPADKPAPSVPAEAKSGSTPVPAAPPQSPAVPPLPALSAEEARKRQNDAAEKIKCPVEFTNSVGMKFVLIPPGEFDMGAPDSDPEAKPEERPQHRVRITKAFYLSPYEVRQGEYEKVVHEPSPREWRVGPEYPVELNWETGVQVFLERLSALPAEKRAHREYRLPTEAEWEYACRAGTVTRYYSGDDREGLKDYAWIPDNSRGAMHPCGQKRPNAWGLFDMHGNIQEWCADVFNPSYYQGSPKDDPLATSGTNDRVHRGGNSVGSAQRSSLLPGFWMAGFRVVMVAPTGQTFVESHSDQPRTLRGAGGKPRKPDDAVGVREKTFPGVFDEPEARRRQREAAGSVKKPVEYTNSIGMKFKFIPSGEFMMGSPDEQGSPTERPQHAVRIRKSFFLGAHEVTVGQFFRFVQETQYKTDAERGSDTPNWQDLEASVTDDHPGVYISWNDAAAFCKWLTRKESGTYRLPTEAEWEYACRAGTGTATFLGDSGEVIDDFAWHAGNAQRRTHAVGQKRANPWGLHDMYGNVWEWCDDWYDPTYYAKAERDDPPGPASGSEHMIRGGSYDSTPAPPSGDQTASDKSWIVGLEALRSASRGTLRPDCRFEFVGFRVLREIEGVVTPAAGPTEKPTGSPITKGSGAESAVPAGGDADRIAAEWTIAQGGVVWVLARGERIEARDKARLPAEPFQVDSISLAGSRPFADHEVARLVLPSKVRELGLVGTRISDKGLEKLKGLANLELLELGGTRISDVGMEHLASLTSLKQLELYLCPNVTDAGLKHLSALRELRRLNLDGTTKVTDAGLASLGALTKLQHLRLRDTQVSGAGLKNLTGLVELTLENTKATDNGLAGLEPLANLESLILGRTWISEIGLEHIGRLTSLKQLELYLCPNVTDVGLKHLSALRELRRLNLDGTTKVTDAGLASLGTLTKLQHLRLRDSQVSGAGLKNLTGLVELTLENAKVMDDGLGGLEGLANLESLNLSGAQISDDGLKHLARLKSLKTLAMESCPNVTGAGFAHLAALGELQEVHLQRSKITDAGLAGLGTLANLRVLVLHETQVSDARLDDLKPLRELRVLGLARTRVTDKGVRALCALAKLESLDLNETAVTAEGIKTLKAALPGCNVTGGTPPK